jgi:hypothetical protein
MTAAQWESPATGTVHYRGPDYALTLSREDRMVAWDVKS